MGVQAEVSFSELVQRPVDTVAKLDAARGRTLRVRRRGDAEDLVLTTASRAEQGSEVASATTRMFVALMQNNPRALSLLVDVVPSAFPWVRFLPREDVQAFVIELVDILEAADSLENPAPVVQVIREWRHTAEVYADPELAAALRGGTDGDYGPVAPPAA
jgi:hypothetical protein